VILYRICVSLSEVSDAKITVQPVVYELNKSTVMEHRLNDTDREKRGCTNRFVRLAHCPSVAKITVQPVVYELNKSTDIEHRWNDTDKEKQSCTNRFVRLAHCPH
jgi:hypothetical protein